MAHFGFGDPARARGRWFLVYALPHSEHKADFHLRAQGFPTFFPRIQKTIRHARQLKTVRKPLFPRYLFVFLDLDSDPWLSVRSTIGVTRLVSHADGRPIPVPRGVVESLLALSDDGLIRLDCGLKVGQRVRIQSGPLAESIGTIEWLNDCGRVRVLLAMMSMTVSVSLPRSAVAPAA